jgi:hypothetical protein
LRVLQFLVELWSALPRALVYPVVEAVSAVSTVSGERIPREAAELLIGMCQRELRQQQEQQEKEEEYLVALLDVITGLLPSKALDVGEFEGGWLYPLFNDNGSAAVLQSVFGFVGDALKNGHMLKFVKEYCTVMEVVVSKEVYEEVEDEWMPTRNNALWALGEAIYRGHYGPSNALCECLLRILRNGAGSTGLMDNAAVTLGRCLLWTQVEVDPRIINIAIKRVMDLPDGEEKESSQRGFSLRK